MKVVIDGVEYTPVEKGMDTGKKFPREGSIKLIDLLDALKRGTPGHWNIRYTISHNKIEIDTCGDLLPYFDESYGGEIGE